MAASSSKGNTPPKTAFDLAEKKFGPQSVVKTKCPAKPTKVTVAVRKAIHDNLAWADERELHTKKVDDVTMYDRLYKDKYDHLMGIRTVTFGKVYYAKLFEDYGSPDHIRNKLKIPAGAAPSEKMMVALRGHHRDPPKRGPMKSLAETCVTVTPADAVCFCLALLDLHPNSSSEQLNCAVAIVDGMARSGSWEKQPELFGLMRDKIDETLLSVARGRTKNG
eukprot:166780-Amphidinium_carterae.2